MSETSASAATAQGSALAKPRDGAADGAPAGVPQRWQKRAPGVSDAEQVAQVAPASAVPQLEQKRPEAGAPHAGQRDVLVPSGVGASGESRGCRHRLKATSRRRPLAAERAALANAPRRDGRPQVWWLPPGCEICSTGLLDLPVLAGHAHEVGLRDDADERAALVDDRDAADLLAAHQLHRRLDRVVGAARLHAARHHSLTGASRRAALGHGADGDVAIGDDADEATARLGAAHALDDRHEADVLLLHQLRGLRHRRVRVTRSADSST